MRPTIVITGVGAVSGFGLGVDPLWRGLLAGFTALHKQPALDDVGLDDVAMALAPRLSLPHADEVHPLLSATPRAVQLTDVAVDEALRAAGLTAGVQAVRLGICLGTTHGEKSPWVAALRARLSPNDGAAHTAPLSADTSGPAAPALHVARRLGATQVQVVCTACASGNSALAVAHGWLTSDLCDVVLAGGVDTLHDFVVRGFRSLKAVSSTPCRPFDADRAGLSPGEGAGILVLETAAHAHRRGATPLAVLAGVGQAADATHMTGPDRQGRGAAAAMSRALAQAGRSPDAIDFVSAHGTATVFNDLMEKHALGLVFGARAQSVPVNSVKGAVGHTMGAAAALEAVLGVLVLRTGLVPPTVGLVTQDPAIDLRIVRDEPLPLRARHLVSTASGFGGMNAAIVLSHPEDGV